MEGLELEQQGSMILSPPDDSGGSRCLWVILLSVVLLSRVRCSPYGFPGEETWMDELRAKAAELRTDGGQCVVRRSLILAVVHWGRTYRYAYLDIHVS